MRIPCRIFAYNDRGREGCAAILRFRGVDETRAKGAEPKRNSILKTKIKEEREFAPPYRAPTRYE